MLQYFKIEKARIHFCPLQYIDSLYWLCVPESPANSSNDTNVTSPSICITVITTSKLMTSKQNHVITQPHELTSPLPSPPPASASHHHHITINNNNNNHTPLLVNQVDHLYVNGVKWRLVLSML